MMTSGNSLHVTLGFSLHVERCISGCPLQNTSLEQENLSETNKTKSEAKIQWR